MLWLVTRVSEGLHYLWEQFPVPNNPRDLVSGRVLPCTVAKLFGPAEMLSLPKIVPKGGGNPTADRSQPQFLQCLYICWHWA